MHLALILLLNMANKKRLELSLLTFSFFEECERYKELSLWKDFLTVAKHKPRTASGTL
ncbi:hypothetical protein FOVG_02160 [Fusarium oxysporum f. sp. pisi HDV247]|uniref:Uncharacterized protein n=1 Tax=Fusarium oxysporum f. sp. pisi HDV247 TaxID=1080344 RepID=W9QKD8_FUSOX|nr:hypothetical protein FOVG_02160 [Fusarium oxysporum f. sp. pisi HDV247]